MSNCIFACIGFSWFVDIVLHVIYRNVKQSATLGTQPTLYYLAVRGRRLGTILVTMAPFLLLSLTA
jgi:hypothetical protein